MRLVAAVMIGDGEQGRYLDVTLPALLEFCDAVVAVDESTDGSGDLAYELGAMVERTEPGMFFAHEGRARQLLLDVALEQKPTHVLAIDADELVTDGHALRAACESVCPVLTLPLREIWRVSEGGLGERVDGAWATGSGCVWKVPARLDGSWRIQDKALSCGRDPMAIRTLRVQRCYEPAAGAEILHLGWANQAERAARYQRYVVHDGGRFHANTHLQSIMWPDARVRLRHRSWPLSWPAKRQTALVDRANRA